MQEMAAERRTLHVGRALTHSAESNLLPHYSADGRDLVWLQYDGYTLPYVRAMPVGSDVSKARDIVQIDAMGPFDLLPDNSLVYEQGRVFRTVYSYEDLFRWDARTGQTVRLTTGKRARDPAVSPDGRRVAFSMNEHSTSVLAVMPLGPGEKESVVWRGDRFDECYQPAWSPDGTRIAFSAWLKGGYRDILVVELASGKVDAITHDRAVDMEPAWSADGKTLYFDSNRTGITNIYAFDFADRSTWQVTNVLGGAFASHASPDGKRIAFENAVAAGGYDLYELPLDRSTWIPARDYLDDKPPPTVIPDTDTIVSQPRPYRALETLAPQTWVGTLDTSADTLSITTGGTDAVGLHSYSLAVGLDLDRGDTNVGASYNYAGFRPQLGISGARSIVERGGWKVNGVNKTYFEEDWSGTLSLGIPLESRPSSSWSLSFDYDFDWFRLAKGPLVPNDPNQREPIMPPTNYVQAGVGSRLAFSRVRSTTFALGPQTGFDASVSLRVDHPAFGATYHNVTVSYATDMYQRLWGVTPVLALRLVGAIRTGDLVADNGFGLGGIPAQDVAMSIVNSARSASSGYLRGYAVRSAVGNQYHLLNLEYRQELWQIEHGLGTLPIYIRRLHLGLLTDAGTAFNDTFDPSKNLRLSVGAALRVDAFFGYFVPGTFEIGWARGLIEGGLDETWFLLTGSL